MTEQELQTIINEVLSAIRTNSRTIGQLTSVTSLADGDYFEVAGGKKVAYSVLRDLIAAAANIDSESIETDIAKLVVQDVSFEVTGSTATLTIKQAGYDAKTVNVPVATDEQSGIITAAQKVKLDTAYTAANAAYDAATAAQQGVNTLNNKLGANSGIATLDSEGKLNSSQLPDNVPTLNEGKLDDDVLPDSVATLDENGKLPASQLPDLSELDDVLEFYVVIESATINQQSLAKYSYDEGVQIVFVATSGIFAAKYNNAYYGNWLDRELFCDTNGIPHAGKTYVCTSTDVLYYWKASAGTLQPVGKDFTDEIQAVADDLDDLSGDVDGLADSLAPRLFFNGNVLTGNAASNLSLSQFVALTAGDTYAFVRKKGVVVTLSTNDGLKSYQWKGTTWGSTDDWKEFGGSAAVGNCYNVTNEASDLLPAGTGYFTLATAIAATQTKGFEAVGMQITFASGQNTWKTYQYVGADTSSANFTNVENWVDMAGMSAGSEAVLNVLDLCGPCTSSTYYNLSYAIAAIVAKSTATGIDYTKSGLVITYPVGENVWETKQFNGSVIDFGNTSLWHDFGGGGGSEVETSDEPESGGEDAFSTGGAYEHLAKGAEMLEASEAEADPNLDNPDTENYNYFYLVNEDGDRIGLPFAIPKGGGGGGGTTKTFSVNFQTSPLYAAVGGTFVLHAAIRSATDDGGVVTPNTITNIQVIDRDTSQVLYIDNQPHASSASSTDYTFAIDISQWFTAATTRRLQVVATDDEGDHASRTINVVAVDVTVESVQVLNYTPASVVFTTDSVKSLPMFRFPNNQGTITAKVDMYIDDEWVNIGTTQVSDSYAHNISVNPTELGLTHGSYPIRVYGTDAVSNVTGNTIYSTIMVVDTESTVPIVAIRYDDRSSGTVKMYETVVLEVAAYTPSSSESTVAVQENGTAITTLSLQRNAVGTVRRQVSGVSQGATLAYKAVSGVAESGTVTLTVSGSVIDASLTTGAVCTFDFANRTNSEAGDHEIVSGDYEIEVTGANWSSNGFNNYLGANALAIKENVTAELNLAPFATADVASTGFALLFQFATNNIADNSAHLLECYDEQSGAGFYVTGQAVGIKCGSKVEERTYSNGEKVTVGILVEPSTKYVEFKGTRYSLIKLFLDGEECACVEYTANSDLLQDSPIRFNGTSGDLYLYYMIAWMQNIAWMQQFYNYLVKLTDTTAMLSEYDFEDVWSGSTANGPTASKLSALGMPYLIEAPFNGSDVTALDNTTSTKTNNYITLTYRDPGRPWRNFVATDVRRRNQGTTSAKRPIKNARYYLAQKNGSTYDKVNKTGGTVVSPELTRDAFIAQYGSDNIAKYDEAVALFAKNKVRVKEDSIPVDLITVKVDYSDSTNANDCGACNIMNTVYRALGSQYMTPAQRYYDGTYDIGSGQSAIHLTGLPLNHSTANHPIAMYRDADGTGSSLVFYAKGNWKEDKSEQVALGFKDTPGYNKGCLNYGDFVEFFGTSSESLSDAVTRFLSAGTEKDESKVYLISQYCGSSYKFYRYVDGAWTDTTGTMQQVNGVWTITGDVLNPVDGFELLAYQGMCWWQGVASVSDMMAPVSSMSSWVQKLVESGDVSAQTFPAWTQYFECMIDNDQLQIDLAYGRKVPYWLFRLLKFCNDCDYSDPNVDLSEDWHDDLYKYVNPYALYVYNAFTDYLAAVDQQAKNMQPMFFLDEGGSVSGGVYNSEQYMRMYPNKVYDADTLNGKDNAGGATVDPEVDPNKPSDPQTGYNNPYAGWGSVLWNNIYRQPVVKANASDEIDMQTVAAAMRSVQATVDGLTLAPFSPEGCKHFFLDNICKRWQKTVSSYDGESKYIDSTSRIDTTVEDNTTYFYALHGLRLTALPSFIDRRWRVRDGFYRTGLFFSGVWSARINGNTEAETTTGITIKAAKTGYFGVGSDNSGNLRESVYLEAGQTHRFTLFDHTEGSLLYIYQANRIKEIDLSEISMSQSEIVSFSAFGLCEKLTIGSNSHVNLGIGSYAPLTEVPLGSLPFLKELNIVNTLVTTIDAGQCPRLETLVATGSPLATLTLAETSPVTVLTLPATMSRLTLVNLPNLAYASGSMTFAGMASLTQLRVDGCPKLDCEQLLTDAVAAGAVLTRLRMAGLDATGPSSTLIALKDMGVRGLDASGDAISESGQCSGLTGRWTMEDTISDASLLELQQYFPELTVRNPQYTAIEIDDTESYDGNIRNLDNNTKDGVGTGYVPSGHIDKIWQGVHVYKGQIQQNGKMKMWQVNDQNIHELANGDPVDLTDSGAEGYDFYTVLPHYWYKGVNDHLHQKKYMFLSSEALEPESTSKLTRRSVLNLLPVESGKQLQVSSFSVGDTYDASLLVSSVSHNVYRHRVEGTKQVRWPGVNSNTIGGVFLDADDKVISTVTTYITNNNSDYIMGEYFFVPVPAGAVSFVFTSPSGFGILEAIAVDSSEVEAIEPDWVEHDAVAIGRYQMSVDTFMRPRSISGMDPVKGSGTSRTSTYWEYDAAGNPTVGLPPAGTLLNYTCKDLHNLALVRGDGFQCVDYNMHKDVANLWMAWHGRRNSQAVCGTGAAAQGAVTGYTDDNPTSAVMAETTTGRVKTMGFEDWWENLSEWMWGVAVNVTSWSAYKANKSVAPAGSTADGVWNILRADGTEDKVHGATATNEIMRVRHGRYCDIVPSKITTNSSYNTYYCDQYYYNASTGRGVLRSGRGTSANNGVVYSDAGSDASVSHSGSGSRLAFRGEFEWADDEEA